MIPKFIIRFVAFLVIPGLVADPICATGTLSQEQSITGHSRIIHNFQGIFQKEAFELALVAERGQPLMQGRRSQKIQRQGGEKLQVATRRGFMADVGAMMLVFSQFSFAQVRAVDVQVLKVLNWIKQNHMLMYENVPKSFQVLADKAKLVWDATTAADSMATHIQRAIIDRGLEIYDGALAQMLWMIGDNLDMASVLTRGYMGEERISAFQTLRGWFRPNDSSHPFQYGEGTNGRLGPDRGWLFRIFADVWQKADPVDGRIVTWEDWKPIAGENAWAAMGGAPDLLEEEWEPTRQQHDGNQARTELGGYGDSYAGGEWRHPLCPTENLRAEFRRHLRKLLRHIDGK